MKIAISTDGNRGMNENVSNHFGRCKTYTIIDENGQVLDIVENKSSHAGGEKLPPYFLKDLDIDILFCQGIGYKALSICIKIKSLSKIT